MTFKNSSKTIVFFLINTLLIGFHNSTLAAERTAFSLDGTYVISGNKKSVTLQDLKNNRRLWTHTSSDYYYGNAMSGDGGRFAISTGGKLLIFDTESQKLIQEIGGIKHAWTYGADSISLSYDGKYIAAAHDIASVWDVKSGKKLVSIEGDRSRHWGSSISDVKLSRDGKILIARQGTGKDVTHVWDVLKNKLLYKINALPISIQLSESGKYIFGVTNSRKVMTWELKTGKLISEVELKDYIHNISSVVFDDRFLVGAVRSGKSTEIMLISVSNNKIVKSLGSFVGSNTALHMTNQTTLFIEQSTKKGTHLKEIQIPELSELYLNDMHLSYNNVFSLTNHEEIYKFIDRYESPLNEFFPKRDELVSLVYTLWKKTLSNEINALKKVNNWTELLRITELSTTPHEHLHLALAAAMKSIDNQPSIEALEAFLMSSRLSLAHKKNALIKLYAQVIKLNNEASYLSLIKNHPDTEQAIQGLGKLYQLVKKYKTISKFEWFLNKFPNSVQSKSAISEILNIVSNENNVAGYAWFIKRYSGTQQAKDALLGMHEVAYSIAKDINTIESYNDFIIAYPTAKQIQEAQDKAYELEKSEYVGILSFFNEEKNARRLLIQSKILEQSSHDQPRDHRTGYMIVVNRMNDLLKHEFNSTEAALRHLESNEFKSFVKTFKSSMRDLKRQVARIAANTEDLSSIMKNQSKMMDNHFENAAQDREMASELTEQHRFWERYIGEVGY